jgi:hypothetical protein
MGEVRKNLDRGDEASFIRRGSCLQIFSKGFEGCRAKAVVPSRRLEIRDNEPSLDRMVQGRAMNAE